MSRATRIVRGAQRRVERWRWPCQARLVFVHMPKCGGTSVVSELTRSFPPRRSDSLGIAESLRAARLCGRDHAQFIRDLLAYRLEAPGPVRFLTGHWVVDTAILDRHCEQWNFVTVLRDPVERWISNYFYDRFKDNPNYRVSVGLSEFLEAECAGWYGSTYVRHLSACRFDRPVTDDDISAACENLKRFAAVGLLSDLVQFSSLLKRQFGITATFDRHERPNPARQEDRHQQLTPEILERIRELCRPDLLLYNSALAAAPPAEQSTSDRPMPCDSLGAK